MNEPWWTDLPELDEPVTDYLANLTARTDALLARLHDERGPVVTVDHGQVSAWLDSRSRDHDVDSEAAA